MKKFVPSVVGSIVSTGSIVSVGAQIVAANATDCGFDPISRK